MSRRITLIKMKRKTFFYFTYVMLLLTIGLGGTSACFDKSTINNGILNVNGTDITSKNVTIRKEKFSNPVLPFPNSFIVKISDYFSNGYYYHADLPLTEVMKSLGMRVEWIDDITANVTYEDKKYVLDLAKVSIVEVGTKHNLISAATGGHRVYTVLDRELRLDDNTIKAFMYELGKKIDVHIDFDELVVYLTEREN